MPSQAVADRPKPGVGAAAIIRKGMAVMTSRSNQIEPDSIPPPMRRAFESSLEKAFEWSGAKHSPLTRRDHAERKKRQFPMFVPEILSLVEKRVWN
jgi:hypothetical protein